MEILVNTDKNFKTTEGFQESVQAEISKKLNRFAEYITTIEVFFADENAGKSSAEDKRCTIELRPRNMKAEAVTHHADTVTHALVGAIEKAKSVLDSRIGKLQSR